MQPEPAKQFHDEWPNIDADFEELKQRGIDVNRVAFESRPPEEEPEPVVVKS